MDPADSLGPYRDAAEVFPELAAPEAASNESQHHDAEDMQRLAKVGAFPSKYRGIQQLRQANLSTTWTAFDIERQAKVVIKEPAARMLLDDEAAARFRQEVQIAAKLSHPNIVPILATELSEPPWFFTMPFVDGLDFDRFCHQQNLGLQDRLRLFLKVCDAVSYAHEQGVIHRDLKPNNILVSELGEPQLLDFGLGRFINAESPEGEVPSGFIAGTPRYMAPEQAAGFPGNTRTDVYALGSILYELTTGKAPIELTPAAHTQLIQAIRETTPPPPRERCPDLATEINAIILRAIHKEPEQRYQSVRDLARDIEHHLTHRPVSAMPDTPVYRLRKWVRRNRVRVSLTMVLVVVASTLAFLSWQKQRNLERDKAFSQSRFVVQAARWRAASDDPVGASRALWREHLASPRLDTEFGLLELFLRYPCIRSIPQEGIHDLAYSPSGAWLVAATADGEIIVYRAETGEEVQHIRTDSAPIFCLRFTPDGKHLITGGRFAATIATDKNNAAQGLVCLWPFDEGPAKNTRRAHPLGRRPHRLPIPAGTVYSLAVTPDGSTLAAGTGTSTQNGRLTARGTGECLLWSLADLDAIPAPTSLASFPGHMTALAFSDDGRLLAMGTSPPGAHPAALRIIDAKTLAVLYDTTQDGQTYRSLAFDPSHGRLLIGGKHLQRLDLNAQTLEPLEAVSGNGVRSFAMTGPPDRPLLAWSSGDGRIRLIDAASGHIAAIQGYHDVQSGRIRLAYCSQHGTIASAGPASLKIWRFNGPRDVALESSRTSPRARVHLFRDGHALNLPHDALPNGPSFSLWQWDAHAAPSHSLVRAATPPSSLIMDAAPAANGEWIALVVGTPAGDRASTVIAGRLESGGFSPAATLELGEGNVALHMHWTQGDSPVLLLACRDGELQAWNPQASSPTKEASLEIVEVVENEECTYVTSDADGNCIAACWQGTNRPGRVALWRRSPRGEQQTQTGFASRYVPAAPPFETHPYTWRVAILRDGLSPYSPILATSGESPGITLWNPLTGSPMAELRGHRRSVDYLLAANDRLLVSSSRDGTVRLWDAWQHQELSILHERDETMPEGFVAPISLSGTCLAINTGTRVKIIDLSEIDAIIEQNRACHAQDCGNTP